MPNNPTTQLTFIQQNALLLPHSQTYSLQINHPQLFNLSHSHSKFIKETPCHGYRFIHGNEYTKNTPEEMHDHSRQQTQFVFSIYFFQLLLDGGNNCALLFH